MTSQIYYVDGITVYERFDVVDRDVHDPLSCRLRRPRDVRRDDAVLRGEKRIIPLDRFCGHDIETGGVDLPAVQGVCKILLMDQTAAAVVDDDHAVLHPGDTVFVDHFLVFRKKRAVKEDDIRLRVEGVKIHIFRQFSAVL